MADHWDGYIYRISDNGATVETYLEIGSAIDFDWAENGNMYIVTNGANLWMYDGETVTLLDEGDGEYKGCRIFGDHLYVTNRGDDRLHKWPITSDGVGTMEIINEDNNPKGIDINADGTLIVTSSRDYSLFLYDENGVSLGALFDGQLAG